MPRKKKGQNKINGDDAQEIVELVEQLADGFKNFELEQVQGVFFGRNKWGRVTGLDIEYNTEVEVEKPNGRKVTREATVSTSVEIQQVPERARLAPFELVHGLIAPAEEHRFEIIAIMAKHGINYEHPPIFAIPPGSEYLVYADKFYIVNVPNETISEPTTLEEFSIATKALFEYQHKRVKEIYG